MKVKIKSFDEIVDVFEQRFSIKPFILKLFGYAFKNAGGIIEIDREETDSLGHVYYIDIEEHYGIPAYLVEKELPAEPETTEQEITADTIRDMQNTLSKQDKETLDDLIGDIARIAPLSNCHNLQLNYLLKESICYQLTRRGFKVTTTGNNIQQSTCISW